jgi:hypothetical protein
MRAQLDLIVLAAAALPLLLPVVWAWRLALMYLRGPGEPPPDAGLPTAAVVLPLRGADPSLPACLRALLRQDYPRYRLLIVVDSPDDPAWGPVRAALAEGHGPGVEAAAEPLLTPLQTCSLKLSAIIQAVSRLGGGYEVVALVDADAVVPPDWLRRLAAPLADPRVGATSGLRWFAPEVPSWGSLVRHLWNCGCQAGAFTFGVPWGGSMAVPGALLHEGGLLAQWRCCFVDDTGAAELIRRRGLRVCFVPAVTVVNRERTSLGAAARLASRQLLNGRLDLAGWPKMLAFNAVMAASLAMAAAWAAAGLASGDVTRAVWFAGLLALSAGGLASALAVAEAAIRRQTAQRGERLPPLAPLWRYPLATALTLAVQWWAVADAALARRVHWRGVDYDIGAAGRARLVEYRPYRPTPGEVGSSIG